jgi:YggT family protein
LNDVLATFVDYLVTALSFAIFGRVIMSWVSPAGKDPISTILIQITEPILRPIRSVMPRTGGFDLTPMIALLALNFLVRPLLLAMV